MEVVEKEVLVYDGGLKRLKKEILVENELDLIVDGKALKLNCTKQDLEDFIYGYLFTQGYIGAREDIGSIELKGSLARVETKVSGKVYDSRSKAQISMERILATIGDFGAMTDLFSRTRASHSCALYDGTRQVVRMDDIGRHNALDKVIGYILRNNYKIDDSLIYITGRLPLDSLEKVKKIGMGTIITLAKPTNLAIDFAQENEIMIIGETRKANHFIAYSCINRLGF